MVNSSSIQFEWNTVDVAVFSTLMERCKAWAWCKLPVLAGGISKAGGNQSGRFLIFMCNSLNASPVLYFFKYFFQAAKGGMFLSCTDYNLEVFVYIYGFSEDKTIQQDPLKTK